MDRSFFTREEVADLLRVSLNTVVRMQERGELPTFRVGRKCVRIPAEAVERHLDRAGTTEPQDRPPAPQCGECLPSNVAGLEPSHDSRKSS
jgi:excisionase family DNA binding protein